MKNMKVDILATKARLEIPTDCSSERMEERPNEATKTNLDVEDGEELTGEEKCDEISVWRLKPGAKFRSESPPMAMGRIRCHHQHSFLSMI